MTFGFLFTLLGLRKAGSIRVLNLVSSSSPRAMMRAPVRTVVRTAMWTGLPPMWSWAILGGPSFLCRLTVRPRSSRKTW